jgi:hypothetical protein
VLGAERGSHPPRYRPSYRAPQVIRYGSPRPPPVFPGQRGFQSPSAPCRLAATSAPACSAHVIEVCVPSMPWPGLAPGFPRSALGVRPEDPFRVAQHRALGPPRLDCGRAGGYAPTRRVWCCTSPHFRRHAAHPAEGGGGGLPSSRPAPAPTGRSVTSSFRDAPPRAEHFGLRPSRPREPQ